MQYQDYYKTLGVERTASAQEIKHAYRRLAQKYHPDRNAGADAEERFKQINEAYEVLSDTQKRQSYDQLGPNWHAGQEFRPPPGWQNGFEFRSEGAGGFSDFFEGLFGGVRGGSGGFRSARGQRGEDVEVKLALTLEEAYQGGTRTVQIPTTGVNAQGQPVRRYRALSVRIPAGAQSGQRLRLAGQGEPGMLGGARGDVYLDIELQPHALYRLEGRDVYLDLPLAPWEAGFGTRLAVPTLGGKVNLNIPAGAQSGQKLRLRGRGLPGEPAGDQYVVVQIINPKLDSDAARELYKTLEQRLNFNPRADWAG